ncbi:MAG: hypothetical protein JRG73_10720 [Deltaproteobacteria bacterium]|nr:hypothetical protein [Deltaproteobacteria bacterium]MBW2307397.1 hypothetical protein [Deltaproteobacteria bacterium]
MAAVAIRGGAEEEIYINRDTSITGLTDRGIYQTDAKDIRALKLGTD